MKWKRDLFYIALAIVAVLVDRFVIDKRHLSEIEDILETIFVATIVFCLWWLHAGFDDERIVPWGDQPSED